METLLVASGVAATLLPPLGKLYRDKQVELRVDAAARAVLADAGVGPLVDATEEDWHTEYLAPVLAIKVVDGLDAAIEHINHYGSHHTDAIVTEDHDRAMRFLREVDSASVMVNASTLRGRLRIRPRRGNRHLERQAARTRPRRPGRLDVAEVRRARTRRRPPINSEAHNRWRCSGSRRSISF